MDEEFIHIQYRGTDHKSHSYFELCYCTILINYPYSMAQIRSVTATK